MKWTIAVALVAGFVLAMALIFGGRTLNRAHAAIGDKDAQQSDACVCCGDHPPLPIKSEAPPGSPAVSLPEPEPRTH